VGEDLLNDVGEFTDRQFIQTAWIAKLAAQWLGTVCRDVSVSRGRFTAHLRRTWKLDTLIPELRYEAGLPVLDREGKEVSQEDFERHRAHWEGHRKAEGVEHTERELDKRIDHRQHAVDALVIGLTSRSLFQRMAETWKAEYERAKSDKTVQPKFDSAPPIADLRNIAQKRLRDLEVSHKGDRHLGGPLFKENPSGIARDEEDGTEKLIQRKAVAELAKPKESDAKVRSRLGTIASKVTRDHVVRVFDERVATGKTAREALAEPMFHPGGGGKVPIRYVKLFGDSTDTAIRVRHHSRAKKPHVKRLVHDGVAYLEVTIQDGKVVGRGRVVRPAEALQRQKAGRKDLPPGMVRFYKGDTVRDRKDGSLLVVGYITETMGALHCKLHTETPPFDKVSNRGKRKYSGRNLAQLDRVTDV
jgi:CRISPR-associated endonuclease Csn1